MYKVIIKYSKTKDLKFISHLDVLRLMQRAVNRAGLPAKYSEGFNPHMKMSFGFPLSLGVESIGEYYELELTEYVDTNKIIDSLNEVLPKKIRILAASYYEGNKSLMSMCSYAEYLITIEGSLIDSEKLKDTLCHMTDENGLIYVKEKKGKNKNKIVRKEINTNTVVHYAGLKPVDNQKVIVEAVFKTSENGSLKVSEFMKILEQNGNEFEYFSAIKIDAKDENFNPIIAI